MTLALTSNALPLTKVEDVAIPVVTSAVAERRGRLERDHALQYQPK